MEPIDKDLLAKYARGECNDQEEALVHQWLDCNDADKYPDVYTDKKYIRKMRSGWNQLAGRFEELRATEPNKRILLKNRIWAIAATIAILTGVSVFLYQYFSSAWDYKIKYQTTYGEIKQISLEDGTTVTLNACSSLEVAKNYNNKNREVYLQGQAYFQVKHQARAPFIVHTKKLSVTALGTSFDVSAFNNDPDISVSLKEGKVLVKAKVRNKTEDVILAPGEGVIYKRKTDALQTERFNPKVQLAWKQQIISFEDADMQEVVRKLERFYGVKINTRGLNPRHWQLTGEYQNQILQDVLKSLSFNYGLKYKIDGKEVILYNP